MSDYTKFKEIYNEIDCLMNKRVSFSTPEFQVWKVKTERFPLDMQGVIYTNSVDWKFSVLKELRAKGHTGIR